jgi:hypothetical protein
MFDYLYKFNRNKTVLTNPIRTRFPAFPLIAASLALVLCTSSCYTMLKHPRVAPSEYDHEESMDAGCLSCHPSHDIWPPVPRPPRQPPWWLDHDWGNELETVPIRDGFRPTPGKIGDDPPVKMPSPPTGVKIPPGSTVKQKKDSGSSDANTKEDESKDRTIRPKKKKKKKETG